MVCWTCEFSQGRTTYDFKMTTRIGTDWKILNDAFTAFSPAGYNVLSHPDPRLDPTLGPPVTTRTYCMNKGTQYEGATRSHDHWLSRTHNEWAQLAVMALLGLDRKIWDSEMRSSGPRLPHDMTFLLTEERLNDVVAEMKAEYVREDIAIARLKVERLEDDRAAARWQAVYRFLDYFIIFKSE